MDEAKLKSSQLAFRFTELIVLLVILLSFFFVCDMNAAQETSSLKVKQTLTRGVGVSDVQTATQVVNEVSDTIVKRVRERLPYISEAQLSGLSVIYGGARSSFLGFEDSTKMVNCKLEFGEEFEYASLVMEECFKLLEKAVARHRSGQPNKSGERTR